MLKAIAKFLGLLTVLTLIGVKGPVLMAAVIMIVALLCIYEPLDEF